MLDVPCGTFRFAYWDPRKIVEPTRVGAALITHLRDAELCYKVRPQLLPLPWTVERHFEWKNNAALTRTCDKTVASKVAEAFVCPEFELSDEASQYAVQFRLWHPCAGGTVYIQHKCGYRQHIPVLSPRGMEQRGYERGAVLLPAQRWTR